MGTTSARPDLLHGLAEGVGAHAARAHGLIEQAAASHRRYVATCPDGDPVPPVELRARGPVDDLAGLAASVRQLADAFATADRGGGPRGVAVVDDVRFADHLATHHPGIAAGDLLDPRRELDADGRRLGARLRALTEDNRLTDAEGLLLELPPEVAADASAAAAFFDELPAPTLVGLVDHLAARSPGGWRDPTRALRELGRLHARATWSGEPGHRGTSLDRSFAQVLTDTGAGRDALRLLLAVTARPVATAYLRPLLRPLLLDGRPRDRGLGTATVAALAHGGARRSGDRDAGVLRAIARNPVVADHLVRGALVSHPRDERIERLLMLAEDDAQDELTALLEQTIGQDALAGPDHAAERGLLLNDVVAAVATDPDAVRLPLATWLAETTFDEAGFWEGRAGNDIGDDRTGLVSALAAVASHERSFATAVAGLEVRERTALGIVVEAPPGEAREAVVDALDRMDDLAAVLGEAAERADRPGDPWGWAFTVADKGLDVAQVAVPLGRTAKLVLRPVVDAGLRHAHEATRPEPGDRAEQVAVQQARRRRNAWVAVATSSEHREDLVWDERRSRPGAVTGPADLRRLGTDADGVVVLAAWAARQPADVRALVEDLVPGP